jgi:hypothetical protein
MAIGTQKKNEIVKESYQKIFLIRFLIPRWSSGHPPFFAVSTVLHVIISKQEGYSDIQ